MPLLSFHNVYWQIYALYGLFTTTTEYDLKKRHMRQGGNNRPIKNIEDLYFLFFLEIYVSLVLDFDIFIRYQYVATIELKKAFDQIYTWWPFGDL